MMLMEKIIIGITSPLWVPLGIAAFVVALPFIGAIKTKEAFSNRAALDKFLQDRENWSAKLARNRIDKFLNSESKLTAFVESQLVPPSQLVRNLSLLFDKLVDENTLLIQTLENEPRNTQEAEELYGTLWNELCPIVDCSDLFWLETKTFAINWDDLKSLTMIDRGGFGVVSKAIYKGESVVVKELPISSPRQVGAFR
jgi:hypothetical protein